jgi:hypothetical protein
VTATITPYSRLVASTDPADSCTDKVNRSASHKHPIVIVAVETAKMAN